MTAPRREHLHGSIQGDDFPNGTRLIFQQGQACLQLPYTDDRGDGSEFDRRVNLTKDFGATWVSKWCLRSARMCGGTTTERPRPALGVSTRQPPPMGDGMGHGDDLRTVADVPAAQLAHLTPAQAAPGRDKHQGP